MRAKAEGQLLAAWLNFAHGAANWSELIDTDNDGSDDTPFHDIVAEVETLLSDTEATKEQLERAKDLASAINEIDAKNPNCNGNSD